MESEADYVLALKRNHRHLSEDVKDAFTGRYTQFIYSTLDKDHGRVEERIYTALRPQEVLDESQYEPWKNLSSLVQVERLVTFSDGTERRDKQYYLSSLPAEAVERIGTYIRSHWGIENRLNWHLDVTFRLLSGTQSIRCSEPQHDQETGLNHFLTEKRQAIHSKEIIHRGSQYRLSQRTSSKFDAVALGQ